MKLNTLLKKWSYASVRYFVLPMIIQTAVVHIAIGVFVAGSLIGKSLMIHESALIALSIVVCQIIQMQTFSIRTTKRRKLPGNIRLVKSEVIR